MYLIQNQIFLNCLVIFGGFIIMLRTIHKTKIKYIMDIVFIFIDDFLKL